MKSISDFHYDSKLDCRFLGDFCIKSGTKFILTKGCKLGLSKRVIPENTEITFIGEEPINFHGDKDEKTNRKHIILEIRGEKLEISSNIFIDTELFREMIKINTGLYKISKVSDQIANDIKRNITECRNQKKHKKHDEKHKKHGEKLEKKDEGRIKRFLKGLGFPKA